MSEKSFVVRPEWPTLALILAVSALWVLLTRHADVLGLWVAVPALAVCLTLHSSLQHEVLHGHPLPDRRMSEALVYAPLGLAVPYPRFRDLHLEHHRDANLTDPYDDPETNYLDPVVWRALPGLVRVLLDFNNTLFGRMLIGPAVGLLIFWASEVRAMLRGDRAVLWAWGLHLVGVAAVAAWIVWAGTMPLWAYLLAAYLGLSILKIRTFLEHQAHAQALGRTVIIEDRGILAFLFLNNNFHAVHHACPQVPWYRLPRVYAARRAEFLRRNLGYRYASYGAVFRAYFLRRKEVVPHPLWPSE